MSNPLTLLGLATQYLPTHQCSVTADANGEPVYIFTPPLAVREPLISKAPCLAENSFTPERR